MCMAWKMPHKQSQLKGKMVGARGFEPLPNFNDFNYLTNKKAEFMVVQTMCIISESRMDVKPYIFLIKFYST